mgnify:CR=1 FL=1
MKPIGNQSNFDPTIIENLDFESLELGLIQHETLLGSDNEIKRKNFNHT